MGLFSFVENLQSKIEESVENLQGKIENASNNFQNSIANKVQEFADNLKVSDGSTTSKRRSFPNCEISEDELNNPRLTITPDGRKILDMGFMKRDVTNWKRDKHGRYVSPSAEVFMDDDDDTEPERDSKQEDGWSMDDILALSNSKMAKDVMDSLSDEEKEALGLTQPKMGSMSEDEIDWSNVLRSNRSLAGNDDEDE